MGNNPLKKLYIIGASGFGREVADTVRMINGVKPTYEIAGFIDDDDSKWGTVINDIPVQGGVDYLINISSDGESPLSVIAIASPKIKELIVGKLEGKVAWANIIHPTAIVSQSARLGVGNILQVFTYVGPNASIGNHCALNVGSGLGHDAEIRNYVSIMCHCDITGNCFVDDRVYIASSVAIIPSITVEKDAFIGAGSVVLNNIKAEDKVFGAPARRIK